MNGTFAGCFIQDGRGEAKLLQSLLLVLGQNVLLNGFDGVFYASAVGAVAFVADKTLLVTLDGGFMVGHGTPPEIRA